MCTAKERQACEFEFADNLAWSCANCPKKTAEDLHDYTHKLLRLRGLQKAGYPLKANDLTIDEWLDLGQLAAALDNQRGCPFTNKN